MSNDDLLTLEKHGNKTKLTRTKRWTRAIFW